METEVMDGYIPLLVMLKFSDHGCGLFRCGVFTFKKNIFGR